jgi:cell division protein FtsB
MKGSMKILVGMLLVLLIVLQYKLWFGESGFQQVRRHEQQIQVLKEALDEVERRNSALQTQVDDLKNNMAAIEERARRDLGMIQKNETFFQIIEPAAK